MKKCLSYRSALILAAMAAGCTTSSPTRPADAGASTQVSAINDAKTGITLTTPQPVTPTAGQRLKFADQPLTLTVKNGVTTGSTPLTYSFQVASDAAFATVVYSKDGVAQGSGGQTSLQIDSLPGSADYFWRARVAAGAAIGLYSPGRTFNVGPQVVIQAPALVSPSQGGNFNGTASLIAANAARTGPAGQLFYRFEVSDSSSFTNLVFVSNVAEQSSGQTSVQMTAQLTTNATYYWRVQVSDPASGVSSPYSTVFSFKYVPFDPTQATFYSSPADLGYWNETAKITSIVLNYDGIQVDFDRRDGPNRWPDEQFGAGSIQYTLGMCLNIDSHWDCAAVVQFWYGRELTAGGRPSDVALDWFYGPRWGPLYGHQPADGEPVALFVASGNLRGRNDPGYVTCPRVCERSNFAVVPWSEDANYSFSLGKKVIATKRR
ncbi:MAG TPA: hypothetical protein VGY48_18835 [Vicinamibacterales bacterium]|nr:hypothetical protein [Vicinamibacterales bacterium]